MKCSATALTVGSQFKIVVEPSIASTPFEDSERALREPISRYARWPERVAHARRLGSFWSTAREELTTPSLSRDEWLD